MTAGREALTLPLIFLTVVLGGAVRPGDTLRFVYPPVFALVLALLFLRIVVESGTLAPSRLVSGARGGLANANGAVVLIALWLAASQVLTLLLPDAGLPRLVCGFFLLALLLNTAAAAPDHVRLMRSMAVTFGALFLLKFVVLAGLSAPADGRVKRILQTLLDGVTLGVLMQPPLHPAAGYLGLAMVLLFLLGVFLLPRRAGAFTSALARPTGPPPCPSPSDRRR